MSIPTNYDSTIALAPHTDRPAAPRRFSMLACALLLCGLTATLYLPSLRGPFIIDDDRYTSAQPLVTSSDGLLRMWSTNQLVDYWPMTYTTCWLEWRLWGPNPAGYRITNLILHIATALLVWLILEKLSIPGGVLAALVFAIHPLNVQTIAWVAQRKEALAAFFFVLSILCYLRDQLQRAPNHTGEQTDAAGVRRWYWLSLAAFLLAMLSKSSVATLPAVLLLIVWWLRGRVTKHDFRQTLPFFLVAIGLTCLEIWFQGHGDPHPHFPFLVRLAGSGAVIWFYLAKALLPIELSLVYPRWAIQPDELRWWLPLAAAIVVTALLWRRRNKRWSRAALFAWAYFCVALLPVLGFAETGAMRYSRVADQYVHLALIGIIALLAAAWSNCRECLMPSARWISTAAAALLIGTLSLLSWRQSQLFGSPVELYQHALASNPESGNFLRGALAGVFLAAGRSQEANEQYQLLLQHNPDLLSMEHFNLGNSLIRAGRLKQGIDQYRQALQVRPDFADAHYNLGLALAQTGKTQAAISHFEKALELNPNSADGHNNLANALCSVGRTADAIEHYQQALRLNPDLVVAYYNLANVLRDAGRPEEAVGFYQQVLRRQPDDAAAYATLTKVYAALGRREEAISTAQQAQNLARSQGDAALAQQIGDWLNKYRAQQSNSSQAPNSGGAAPKLQE